MTSFKQIEANRRNARRSTGPTTEEGKQRSRCNAVRHGLTAETVVGALEDAEDYKAFETAIAADYDASSAVERELVLRLRRATTIEPGLFEIQADQLSGFRQSRQANPGSREIVYALFGRAEPVDFEGLPTSHRVTNGPAAAPSYGPKSAESGSDAAAELGRCFLRLANLPNFALDRLSRYEAIHWRQVGQILFAFGALDRCKPQERRPRPRVDGRRELSVRFGTRSKLTTTKFCHHSSSTNLRAAYLDIVPLRCGLELSRKVTVDLPADTNLYDWLAFPTS